MAWVEKNNLGSLILRRQLSTTEGKHSVDVDVKVQYICEYAEDRLFYNAVLGNDDIRLPFLSMCSCNNVIRSNIGSNII